MSSNYIKCGLGGAGNFRLAPEFNEDQSTSLLPNKAPITSFSGIGGAGNYHYNCQAPTTRAFKPSPPPTHFGIGGAGNRLSVIASGSGADKIRSRLAQRRHTSLASSLSSTSDSDDSSSLKSKLVDLKDRITWRSSRIIEVGLDEGMATAKYIQVNA